VVRWGHHAEKEIVDARNFSNYYSLRILAGIKALDNNAEDPAKDAQSFLEQRGLYTPNAQK